MVHDAETRFDLSTCRSCCCDDELQEARGQEHEN